MASSDNRSCLSVGLLIREVLTESSEVTGIANKIFPVVASGGATLPYVCYRRASLSGFSVKGVIDADTISVEVDCYAEDYDTSVRLAEAVRKALDGGSFAYSDGSGGNLVARSVRLSDATEDWNADAYVQSLIFEMKVN